MKLQAFGNTYDLELVVSHYSNNWRLYLGLMDTSDWEPFCDITENHPEVDDKWLAISDDWEKVIIDHDFELCFASLRECKEWCMNNLGCLGWAEVDGLPALYIIYNQLPKWEKKWLEEIE